MIRRKVIVVAALMGIALTSCGSDSSSSEESGVDSTVVVVTTTVAEDGVVNPERVLLAAMIIAVGDIDLAIAEGLVSPDEADAATKALADGTLSEWSR